MLGMQPTWWARREWQLRLPAVYELLDHIKSCDRRHCVKGAQRCRHEESSARHWSV